LIGAAAYSYPSYGYGGYYPSSYGYHSGSYPTSYGYYPSSYGYYSRSYPASYGYYPASYGYHGGYRSTCCCTC
jgi:hypothetical protein